jgi:cyclic pyranopterin phosphate synthase
MPLEDAHGRLISDLRVSVTDRCNFRCRYCMPAEGMPWIPREEILSFEEIERLVRMLVDLGVRDVRLTGGEPLVRREFPVLVARLRGIEGIEDLSLTTNAYLLEDQAADLVAAGIDRVNVSIDSLARARFFEITRRDALDRVLGGLDAIAAFPQVRPVKVNAVPMPGFDREDVLRFSALARERGFQVRFIEFMPLDGDRAWRADEVLTGAAVRAMIEAVHPLVERPREPHSTARVYGFADGRGVPGLGS